MDIFGGGIILLTTGSEEQLILRGKKAKRGRGTSTLIRAMGSRCKFLRLEINSHFF